MMLDLNSYTLPILFFTLLSLSVLIYMLLDGFDLGIGMLFLSVDDEDKERLSSSIAPFWDMNESWLVLAVGLLMLSFPLATGHIMHQLYTPIALMLCSLIIRGASLEFRKLDQLKRQKLWNACFCYSSYCASYTQGWILGMHITGYKTDNISILLITLITFLTVHFYRLLGASWLIAKVTDPLKRQAISYAKNCIFKIFLLSICIAVTLIYTQHPFDMTIHSPIIIYMLSFSSISLMSLLLLGYRLSYHASSITWLPYALTCLSLTCLSISTNLYLYPMIIPGQLTIWESAAHSDCLRIVLYGAMVTLPIILICQVYTFWVFKGKATTILYYSSN